MAGENMLPPLEITMGNESQIFQLPSARGRAHAYAVKPGYSLHQLGPVGHPITPEEMTRGANIEVQGGNMMLRGKIILKDGKPLLEVRELYHPLAHPPAIDSKGLPETFFLKGVKVAPGEFSIPISQEGRLEFKALPPQLQPTRPQSYEPAPQQKGDKPAAPTQLSATTPAASLLAALTRYNNGEVKATGMSASGIDHIGVPAPTTGLLRS